jgi:hypothetical protein
VRSSSKVAKKTQAPCSPALPITEKLRLDSSACLRIALSSDTPAELSLRLLGPNGSEVQHLDGSTPLAFPQSGPLCVSNQGLYSLSITSKSQTTVDWSAWVTSSANSTK